MSIMETKKSNWIVKSVKVTDDISDLISTIADNICISIIKIKFIVDPNFGNFNQKVIKKLNRKATNKSFLIIFATKDDGEFELYWKSRKIKHFLELKPPNQTFSKNDKKLLEFVAEFLGKSLSNGHLGLCQNYGTFRSNKKVELHFLADLRNYNLLLIACDIGNVSAVDILLKYGFDTKTSDKDANAENLAWNGRHCDVLLKLLNTNLAFPSKIDIAECSENLRRFIDDSLEFHQMIKNDNLERLKKILNKHPNLHYFYNLSNESALKVAIDMKFIKVYEFLVTQSLSFGPHEDTDIILSTLNLTDKEDLHEIHIKYLKSMPEKHINVLMANTSLTHDETDENGKNQLVFRAFRTLNENPMLKIILRVVAAYKKFHIVFDFFRDSTYRINPTTSIYTSGIFYFSGRILIGARQLLNPTTENETFGTLIHELCHCAMYAVFENSTNPYSADDKDAIEEFEKISEICRLKMDSEDVVKVVFKNYAKSHHHSELIVRPAHMMALYRGNPKVLNEKRQIFADLFAYFEKIVIPAMEKALPEIEVRLIYKPTFKYSKLSEQNQLKIQNTIVKYKNVKMKLVELFPVGSVAFKKLTSDHISHLLEKRLLSLDDPHLYYLDELINFNWENLDAKLKIKFLNFSASFQNQIVRLKNLQNLYPEAFSTLSSKQIIAVLNGEKLKIGNDFKTDVDFYVDRQFMYEDARQISFEYEYGYDYVHNRSKEAEHKAIRKQSLNMTFEEFSMDFFKLDKDIRTGILEQIKENSLYKIRYYDLSCDYFAFMHKKLAEIIRQAEIEKIFILSNEAGAGKTVAFENLTIEIKKKFSTRWVSYVDLKDFTKFYQNCETFQTVDDVLEFFEKILRLRSSSSSGHNSSYLSQVNNSYLKVMSDEFEFERKIFQESFKSGNFVVLWNGFDEISPTYNGFILNLIKFIHKNTKNVQYVCTRPFYSQQLGDSFGVRTWQLVPFNDDLKINFLKEFFISQNVMIEKINENITKVLEIIEKFNFEYKVFRDFNTPLMIRMVAEIHEDHVLFDSSNIYGIYETFVKKKIRIWLDRCEFAQKTNENLILKSSRVSIMEIYQKYALIKQLKIMSGTTLALKSKKLKIMQKKIPKDLPHAEISRMGILYINGQSKFEFAHKTFCEFFIAQYFIENVYFAEYDVAEAEAELRLEIFFKLLKDSSFLKVIINFMRDFLRIESENEDFSKVMSELLMTRFKRFFMNMLNGNAPEIFEFLCEFFKRDHELLVTLLHVFEDETFYTAIFNPNYFAIAVNPQEIIKISLKYLTHVEFECFIIGKNQKGVILYGMNFYRILGALKLDINYFEVFEATCGEFWEFFEKVNKFLSEDEKKVLFIAALNPKIYLFYDIILENSMFSDRLLGTNCSVQNLVSDKSTNNISFYDQNKDVEPNLSNNIKIRDSEKILCSTKNMKLSTQNSNSIQNFKSKNSVESSSYSSQTLELNKPLKKIRFFSNPCFFEKPSTTSQKKSIISEKISKLSNKLFRLSKKSKSNLYESLWDSYEVLLSKTEMKETLGNAIVEYLEIFGGKKSNGEFFQNFLLKKCEKFLTNSDIFEIFINKNILHESCRGNFEVMWNFLAKHSDRDERREILLRNDDENDRKFYFYYFPFGETKKEFSNYNFYYFYYDFTSFKVLHRFMTVPDAGNLDFVIDIYRKHFKKSEIQKIILSSNDFLYYAIGRVLEVPCKKFATFLEETFEGNSEMLKEFLGRKIKPTNLSIFNYFDDFSDWSEELWFKNLKIFENLFMKLMIE